MKKTLVNKNNDKIGNKTFEVIGVTYRQGIAIPLNITVTNCTDCGDAYMTAYSLFRGRIYKWNIVEC